MTTHVKHTYIFERPSVDVEFFIKNPPNQTVATQFESKYVTHTTALSDDKLTLTVVKTMLPDDHLEWSTDTDIQDPAVFGLQVKYWIDNRIRATRIYEVIDA